MSHVRFPRDAGLAALAGGRCTLLLRRPLLLLPPPAQLALALGPPGLLLLVVLVMGWSQLVARWPSCGHRSCCLCCIPVCHAPRACLPGRARQLASSRRRGLQHEGLEGAAPGGGHGCVVARLLLGLLLLLQGLLLLQRLLLQGLPPPDGGPHCRR